jgi:tRNA threonylcarbamoyladenosine biosynthesis protein TsaE
MEYKTRSLDEFNAEAKRFARTLAPGSGARIVALSGGLGAGKTTYVQTVAREFGVEDQVNSPTFVIEKIYTCTEGPFVRLVHIDAYRLKNAHELEILGWRDIAADGGNLILVEWPENVAELMPADAIRVSLSGADDERTIDYGEK